MLSILLRNGARALQLPEVLEEVIRRAARDCPWTPELTPPAPLVSLESTPHPSLPHLEPFSRMQARESSVLLRPPAQSSGLNTEKAALETWRMLAAGSET